MSDVAWGAGLAAYGSAALAFTVHLMTQSRDRRPVVLIGWTGVFFLAPVIGWVMYWGWQQQRRTKPRLVPMPCQECAPIHHEIRIRKPAELTNFLEQLKEFAEYGVLVQATGAPADLHATTFGNHGEVSIQFECNFCGRQFELHVDSTDETRGQWSPVAF